MTKKYCWPIWVLKSGKKFRPKKRFSSIWFLGHTHFLVRNSYLYQNSNSPLFGPLVKKTDWKCFTTILLFWHSAISTFFQIWFLSVRFFVGKKKVTNIQIVISPYSARLLTNVLEVFHNDIAVLAYFNKCILLIWHPKNDCFPVGPFR